MSTESSYDVLGAIEREVAVGAFDATFLIEAAAEVAKGGVGMYQKGEAGKASARDVDAQAKRAVDADARLLNALALVEVAEAEKDAAKVVAARFGVEQARAAADAAGVGISPEAGRRRVKAAEGWVEKTAAAWRAAPKSAADAARAKAAREVLAIARGAPPAQPAGAPGAATPPVTSSSQEGFLRKVRWGRPTWHWGAGGLGLAAALALALKFFFKRRG